MLPAGTAGVDMRRNGAFWGAVMRFIAIILGLVFAVVAVMYLVMPAGSLPAFFPGYAAGSAAVHLKHGLASAGVAVVLFAVAGFARRR